MNARATLVPLEYFLIFCHATCRSVVMVPDAQLDVSHQKEADQVLTSLSDLDPSGWGLPPFESK